MWVPLILVAIILGVVLLRKYNVKMPAMAVKMPEVSGQVIAWVLGGVALLVAGIWLYNTESLTGLEGLDVNLLIAVAILVVLAIAGVLKKGGASGTVALIALIADLFLFGVDAPKVLKRVQNSVSAVILSESSNLPKGDFAITHNNKQGYERVMTWETYNADKSIPVGVRSNEFPLHEQCTLNNYPDGYGRVYELMLFDENQSTGWVTQSNGSVLKGHYTKYAVVVLVPHVQNIKFLEVCPYTLPKE